VLCWPKGHRRLNVKAWHETDATSLLLGADKGGPRLVVSNRPDAAGAGLGPFPELPERMRAPVEAGRG